MAGKGSPGPPKQYPYAVEVKVTEDLHTFISDLAKTFDSSKGAVLRALAESHVKYLTSLATDYVGSGSALAAMEANR